MLLHFDSVNAVAGYNRLLDNSPYQRVVNVFGGSLTTNPANLSPIGSVASLQLNTNSDGSGFPEFPVNARGVGLNAGTGDFTFEWWGKHIGPADGSSSSSMPIGAIFSTENDGANGTPHIWIDRLQNRDNSYSVVLTGWYRSTTGYPDPIRIWAADITSRMGQWTHYAVSRTSGVTRVFINGALATLGTVSNYSSFPFDTTATSVNDPSNWDFLSPYSDATGNTGLSLFGFRIYKVGGFVDEARYTVGVGRYTESFSPYAAAFPNTGPVIVPDAPTNLAATGGNQQIALTWTAPVRNGGDAIIDYVVQYSSNAGSSWTTAEASQTTSKTITGLTNLTGYLVRVAARNSAGVGEYVISGTVTPSEPVVITQQPLNTYTSTTAATAALSVAATVGGGALTYQWQWYGPDYFNSDYSNQWRDMSSQTGSTVSLSANYVSGTLGYYDFDYSPTVKVRCAVAVSGGSPTYTQEVRFICLQNVHAPSAYWYNGTDSGAANSGQPQTISLVNGESLKVDITDSAYGVFDMSWFSGNDVIVKVQVATSGFTDAANWTDLSSTGYRGSFSVSAYEIAPSAGTKYYRVIAVANWPFTATDGTASFSPASPHRYPLTNYDVVQVTWPAAASSSSSSSSSSGSSSSSVTPAANPLTAAGWTGIGTNSSRLTPPGNFDSATISVGQTGVLNVKVHTGDYNNDDGQTIVSVNGVARRTATGWEDALVHVIPVMSGDTVTLSTNNNQNVDWFAATRVWISDLPANNSITFPIGIGSPNGYSLTGAGTIGSVWYFDYASNVDKIPIIWVRGTKQITFQFGDHRGEEDSEVVEAIYSFSSFPDISKNQYPSPTGGTLIASGRNTTVTVTVTDKFLAMRRRNDAWGPFVDYYPQDFFNGGPSVRFFSPS